MAFADTIVPEFDQEMRTTRSLLERVPLDKSDWKPHTKSTAMGALAFHLANLAGFGEMIVKQEGRDFGAAAQTSTRANAATERTREELLALFDENVAKSRAALQSLQDKDLGTTWTLSNGGNVIFAMPRAAVIRTLLMNHIIHHRGQLSVYLRLNDVPLPSIYGPTADT
ncbi:MAG TPA: DinB family protein [Gemmatimonadaceae bacterium]|nr:DinB family protein [Gemmatimonadaceae bacterium]